MTVLVRLKETIEGTDWYTFLLDQSAKGLCQAGTDLRHQIRRLPTYSQ